jgi:hypothetical protein
MGLIFAKFYNDIFDTPETKRAVEDKVEICVNKNKEIVSSSVLNIHYDKLTNTVYTDI